MGSQWSVVLRLFTCNPPQVRGWEPLFLTSASLLPATGVSMLRCRRPGPCSINHTSDSRHGLASVARDLHNLSFWSHYCYVSSLWWKANISAFPWKLLSDGRNKSQEKFLHQSCCSQLLCGIQRISASAARQRKLFDPNAMVVWEHNYRTISSDFRLFDLFPNRQLVD